MNPPKAIEILNSFLDGTYDHRDEDLEDAVKLGSEALKAIQLTRRNLSLGRIVLLAGETEE